MNVIDNTMVFPDLLKNSEIKDDEEDVSYDVDSLFTSIPVKETIKYICDEIYTRKKLKPYCKKLIFKRLLERLCIGSTFIVNGDLIKQIEGCPMGGAMSVVMANIYMAKLERDIVTPMKPLFYLRYVDDCYVRRKKNTQDLLFLKLNEYHPNIKFTIEENPTHFLDTAINKYDNDISTSVYTKPNKLPGFWKSRIPNKYKRNAIRTELHRASKISSDFGAEVSRITRKYSDAGYPIRFINSVVREFNQVTDEPLIPYWLFEDRRKVIIRLPYCEMNERDTRIFSDRLSRFTNDKYIFVILWQTRKIRSLFPLKDKSKWPACVIYQGECSCGETYIGETDRNVNERWSEHNTPSGKSEPAKHLVDKPTHVFVWNVLSLAPNHKIKRKILEDYYIMIMSPTLNEQIASNVIRLFRNGVT